MPASHNTKRKAIETLMHYIECHNVCLYVANLISPCDYKIEAVDLKVDEIIPDFETARKNSQIQAILLLIIFALFLMKLI